MKTRLSKKNTSIDISRLWGFYSELNIPYWNPDIKKLCRKGHPACHMALSAEKAGRIN